MSAQEHLSPQQFSPWEDKDMSVDHLMPLRMKTHGFDPEQVQHYRSELQAGKPLQRLHVEDAPNGAFLGDGHHRLMAAAAEGHETAPVRMFHPTAEGRSAANKALVAIERDKA